MPRIFHVSHIRDKDYRVLRFNDFYTQVTSPEIVYISYGKNNSVNNGKQAW